MDFKKWRNWGISLGFDVHYEINKKIELRKSIFRLFPNEFGIQLKKLIQFRKYEDLCGRVLEFEEIGNVGNCIWVKICWKTRTWI